MSHGKTAEGFVPVAQRSEEPEPVPINMKTTALRAENSAHIINLDDWKKKLAMKSTGSTQEKLTPEQIKSMTLTEKQARIARYIYDDQVSEDMLDSILAITARAQTGERNEG
jgi:hypothetical protein